IPHKIRFTTSSGEITAVCRQLAERSRMQAAPESEGVTDVVAVVGGDGTVHEAVNGLLHAEAHERPGECGPMIPALAYIPAGSGNDYARGHGIPLNPEQALASLIEAIRHRRVKRVDVLAAFGQTIAASSFGAGLDAAVAYAANRSYAKRLLGRIGLGSVAYALTLIRVLAAYRPADGVLEVDGRRHTLRKVWLATLSNIDSYGGGMRINPDAVPDDGLSDVCIVSGLSRLGLLFAFPRVYRG